MIENQIINPQGYVLCPASKEQGDKIDQELHQFNSQILSIEQDVTNFDYIVKDGQLIIAGIRAYLNFQESLYIRTLFIKQEYRNQSLGSTLLKVLEIKAIDYGIKLIHLNTFDFQAKDFYLKNGYQLYATLDYYPTERKLYHFKKIL